MKIIGYVFLALICFSCHSKETTETEATTEETVTPVTVVTISSGPMEEDIELNATSAFLQKWIIKANLTGYVKSAGLTLNQFVRRGQPLFVLQTKEAQSIGNTINKLDPSFHFTGINKVLANGSGFVSELNHQAGDYVQDGEQLAVVTDTKSFAFLLDLPYELRAYLKGATSVPVLLPDGELLQARVSGNMPTMDSSAQTQRVILKVTASHPVPENLIARVKLIRRANHAAWYLPKAAVLSDETQSEFWVMKMLNDSTAAKQLVTKGIETAENVEITSPVFAGNDRILITGNFGLPDTAHVKIMVPVRTTE
ncbi:MAG: HlyD family efflux transporter periplasmic adaptor subunit [Ferruginibacter sp.]|nr:HlyD family efflux transporter periplasmic adaptor subunit [Ferruginibacter sp.]